MESPVAAPIALVNQRPVPPKHETPRPVLHAPIRIALIGPGSFALRVLVPALSAAGAQLELVAGGAGPSAEAAARNSTFARVAESAEAAIADEHVDAVVIATRHDSHAPLAVRALEAGKHVFCEKPLALTSRELEQVLDAAQVSQGILAVGFNRRYSELLQQARAFTVPDGSIPVTVNYRISAGHLSKDHWAHTLEQGGGRILGEVCHFMDSLAFIVGEPILSVYAIAYGTRGAPVQARDNLNVALSFENGSTGTIVYVADGSPRLPKERLEIFSGDRTAILDDYRLLELHNAERSKRIKLRSQDKGHRKEVQAFVDGAREGKPPVPLEEIENVSLATLALVESLRTGRPIRLRQDGLDTEDEKR
jgi:predicted dehydrogenase